MKSKIKKVFKNRIFICILTALITGTVSVCAVTYFPSNHVTYNNTTSGLKSSDVQGAIDELYNTCYSVALGGQYAYYAKNNHYGSDKGTLYCCDASNGVCNDIFTTSGSSSTIAHIYANNDYVFFAVNRYLNDAVYEGNLYRCNAGGGSCISLLSTASNHGIGFIGGNSEFLYYGDNRYIDGSIYRGYLYRCNVDGSSCNQIESTGDRQGYG